MAQTIRRWPLNAKSRVYFQVSSRGIYGGKCGIRIFPICIILNFALNRRIKELSLRLSKKECSMNKGGAGREIVSDSYKNWKAVSNSINFGEII